MKGFDRFVNIEQSAASRNQWRLVQEEWAERAAALPKMAAYAMAKQAFDMLLDEIPDGKDYADLKKALKLVEVSGTARGKEAMFAIYVPQKSARIKSIDMNKTLIFVIPKKKLKRAAADVQVLADFSPWTTDTIPFWPTSSDAVVTQRKVNRKEVERIAKLRKKDMVNVTRRLANVGRKIAKSPFGPGQIKRSAKAIPDVAMQALSLEFGRSGAKSKPVFRKTMMSTKQSVGKLPAKFQQIADAMTDPNSKEYKTWPKRLPKISLGLAQTFAGFQKKLGF